MKMRWNISTIAGALCLLLSVSTFGQSQPPAVIDQLGPDTSLKYLTKVSKIPPSVVEVMKTVIHLDKLEMADKGGEWNATDFIVNPELPGRRLIWAVETQKHFVVHYEQGGFTPKTHFPVVSPPHENGKRKLEWAAVSLNAAKADDLKKFLAMAKDKKLIGDKSLSN